MNYGLVWPLILLLLVQLGIPVALFGEFVNQISGNCTADTKKSLTITCLKEPLPLLRSIRCALNAVKKVEDLLKKAGHDFDKKYLALDLLR